MTFWLVSGIQCNDTGMRNLEITSSPFGFNQYFSGARSMKGFATLRKVVNVQFVAEVKAEVVREVSRSARVV